MHLNQLRISHHVNLFQSFLILFLDRQVTQEENGLFKSARTFQVTTLGLYYNRAASIHGFMEVSVALGRILFISIVEGTPPIHLSR